MGSVWPECIMFELKKFRVGIFNGTEGWCKIWSLTDLRFQKPATEIVANFDLAELDQKKKINQPDRPYAAWKRGNK